MMGKTLLIAAIVVVTALGTACDTASSRARHDADSDGHTQRDEGNGNDSTRNGFGEPAPHSTATRTIPVLASDDLRFDPASISVDTGEVVTFVVKNVGNTDHEFVLGDAAYQEQHETDMRAEHDHMSDETNGVTIHPGETARLTWRFSEAGEVLFGCHEPGHYAGGMVGTIDVN